VCAALLSLSPSAACRRSSAAAAPRWSLVAVAAGSIAFRWSFDSSAAVATGSHSYSLLLPAPPARLHPLPL